MKQQETHQQSSSQWAAVISDAIDTYSSFCTLVIDDQYRIQYANRPYFGQAVDALLGKSCLDEIAPQDRPKLEQAVAGVLRTKTPVAFASQGCGADSKIPWYHTQVLPLPADQDAQQVLLLIEETTDVKCAALAVQQERDLLQSVLNSIPEEVWFIDQQGQFTLFNPAAQQTFVLAADLPVKVETLANTVESFYPDGTPRPPDQAPPLRLLRGETIDYAEEILRLPSGKLRYRQLSLARACNQAGEAIGVVVVVRDITRLKQFATEGVDLLRRIEVLISELVQQTIAEKYSTPATARLTTREFQVLGLLAAGCTAAEIANQLFISLETVKTHRRHLMRKLGLRNKAELIRYALSHGIQGDKK